MNKNRLLLAALLACLSSPAFAAEELESPEPPAMAGAMRFENVPRLHLRGHGAAVKDAPYSARIVSERLQQLADGNGIEQRTSAASYRDSAGRTRHEVRDAKGGIAQRDDQGSGSERNLAAEPANTHGEKTSLGAGCRPHCRGGAGASRAIAQGGPPAGPRARRRRPHRGPDRARGGEPGRAGQGREAREGMRETVRVIRLPRELGAELRGLGPQLGQLGPLIAGAAADGKWASKAVSRDLGTRDFDGVKAEGKLRSYEIPAGEVGNRNPIIVADESWYAPDLQLTVYAKHSDPRSGDYVYRPEGLKRGEPDPALFTVPADYREGQGCRRPAAVRARARQAWRVKPGEQARAGHRRGCNKKPQARRRRLAVCGACRGCVQRRAACSRGTIVE
ncbi:hypothetical protein [Massilia sp. Se16.2.3]|uniref:hypothetical protein n=1 Tax=Massilia sp. Se16.2.3 TaxID=2709303 RepID=UPI0016028A16|nr:hypothetical protein [Massilia sp. Se16.2.3]QNA98634.1 hypothetical protein G4G31_07000 [Massilia sp. Se16.2.3]